jgi:ATP-dependent exoDNAse (exonuclease V) alpha subunit
MDPQSGVCNGTRGILTRASSKVIEVRILTGPTAGSTVFIPRLNIIPTDEFLPFKLRRRQFPVRLSFAMSINKSQGQSVKWVGCDFRSPVFVHGQFYVAVSRVTSVDNIKAIWSPNSEEPITKNIVYPEVLIT